MNLPIHKLGLSAAQIAFDASGPRSRSPQLEAREILAIAARSGLGVLDTQGVHGVAEQILGEALPRPQALRLTIGCPRPDRGPDHVEAEICASLRRMAVDRAHAVVVSSASDLFHPLGGALWERLHDMRERGFFEKLGVAVHATDDPVGVAKRFKPDIIQAPASLLDQRLLANGVLARIAGVGVEVQLRSIFLNGLLFLPPDRVPAQLKGASSRLSRVR